MKNNGISKRMISLLLVLVFLLAQVVTATAVITEEEKDDAYLYPHVVQSFTGPAGYPLLGPYKVKFDGISDNNPGIGTTVYANVVKDSTTVGQIYVKRLSKTSIEWASTFPILGVYVKGGKGGGTYTYEGGAKFGGEISTGSKHGISHITFYYGDPIVIPPSNDISIIKAFPSQGPIPSGATFKVDFEFKMEGGWVDVQDEGDGDILLNSEYPSVNYPSRPNGDYRIKEVDIPDGYELVMITKGGVELTEKDNDGYFTFNLDATSANTAVALVVLNKEEYKPPKIDLTIRKDMLGEEPVPTAATFGFDLEVLIPDVIEDETLQLNAIPDGDWQDVGTIPTNVLNGANGFSVVFQDMLGNEGSKWFRIKELTPADPYLFHAIVLHAWGESYKLDDKDMDEDGYYLFQLTNAHAQGLVVSIVNKWRDPRYGVQITKRLGAGSVSTTNSFSIPLYQEVWVPSEPTGEPVEAVSLLEGEGTWEWELIDTASVAPNETDTFWGLKPGRYAVTEASQHGFNLTGVTVDGTSVSPDGGYYVFEIDESNRADVLVEVVVTNYRQPESTPTPTTTTTPPPETTTPPPETTTPPPETTTPPPETTTPPLTPLDEGFELLAIEPIPEGAPEEDLILTEEVPLDAPELPKTSGLPIGLLIGGGAISLISGLKLKRRR